MTLVGVQEGTGHHPGLVMCSRAADGSDHGITQSLGGWLPLWPFKWSVRTRLTASDARQMSSKIKNSRESPLPFQPDLHSR